MGSHRRLAPSGFDRGSTAAVGLLSWPPPSGAVPAAVPLRTTTGGREVDRLRPRRSDGDRGLQQGRRPHRRAARGGTTAQESIARQQQRVNTMRDALGSLAGAQYRSGGIDPSLALLLSAEPDDYLDRASVLDRITTRQAGELGQLQQAMRDLAQDAGRGGPQAHRAGEGPQGRRRPQEDRGAQAGQGPARCSPPAGRRARRLRARVPLGGARTSPPSPVPPPPPPAVPRAAFAAARSALGKPSRLGRQRPLRLRLLGPRPRWAYAQAGVGIPRTSQAQSGAGQRVSWPRHARGDLVAYRARRASHIGMYAGNSQVIHAPLPRRTRAPAIDGRHDADLLDHLG